jgi:RNA 2',3'-cyclic 3'-phosphodiesterase
VENVGRVFAAVPIPDEMTHALIERVGSLRIPGKVAAPDNWHVTIRFLGSIHQVTYERFLHGLSAVGVVPAFRLGLDGLGAFPNPRRATVVWAGISPGAEGLALLNELGEEAAVAAGLEAEERPFRPHLTLSRVRPPEDVRHLMGDEIRLGWVTDRVVVYRSHPGERGPRYEPLETILLAR